jgi:hypothetical protein
MAQDDEEQSAEELIFSQFLAMARVDIGQYEAARRRGDRDGAAKALRELRRHAEEAREEWLSVEIYYQEDLRPLPWHAAHPSEDLPTALKRYLEIINDELGRGSLQGAGAAVSRMIALIGKVTGSEKSDE